MDSALIVIDEFLNSFEELIEHAKTADFRDIVNPVDGVTYPHICADIPATVKSELLERIAEILCIEPDGVTMFMRRSPLGVSVPHAIHTDNSMGRYSLMLYMNENQEGGTGFVQHMETGMEYAPQSQEHLDIALRDQNLPERWLLVDKCGMKANRACIFEADRFHCALPIGGFGEGSGARTVLTVFFS